MQHAHGERNPIMQVHSAMAFRRDELLHRARQARHLGEHSRCDRPRDEAEVLESIRRCGEEYGDSVKRIFLADGDAMTLSVRRLANVLEAIRRDLPGVRRVSSYCLPRNLRKKSMEELRELAALGLSLVYVGAESGDDEVLARVDKGETFDSTREALSSPIDTP